MDVIPEVLRDAVRTGKGTVDLAPFLNEAIRAIDARGGGTLYFPDGTYAISSLDLSQRVSSEAGITLVGAGREQTTLRAAVGGQVLLDASGRNNLALLDLQIQSGAHVSACGLLLARLVEKPQSTRNRVQNVRVRGSFAVAGVVSAAAESNSWIGCSFENSHAPAAHCCFLTANYPEDLALPRATAARIVAGANTDNVMTDCEFYAPFEGAAPVRFIGAAGYTMLGCSVISGSASGARLVTYTARESIFSGPVSWHNPHLEVFGTGNVVHCLQGSDICYFRGINSYSGNYQVAGDTLLLGQDPGMTGRPVLQNTTWTVPLLAQGVSHLRISLFALTDSTLALDTNGDVSDVEVSGFAANSHISAGRLRIAQKIAGEAACI